MTTGEKYDVLVLSELVSLLLERQLAQLEKLKTSPPTRSDIYVTRDEVHRE